MLRLSAWYPFSLARELPSTFRWFRSGCRGAAPHSVKLRIVRSYLERFSVDQFIETGTYFGRTLASIAETGIDCTSIELSEELYERARDRFKNHENVTLFMGDSAERLPEILKQVTGPALFWLDGHYSAGITASGRMQTPISAELEAILQHPIKKHVILIDDARCFDGTNDYPHLDNLLRTIRKDGSYRAEVSTDIIRLVPRIWP